MLKAQQRFCKKDKNMAFKSHGTLAWEGEDRISAELECRPSIEGSNVYFTHTVLTRESTKGLAEHKDCVEF